MPSNLLLPREREGGRKRGEREREKEWACAMNLTLTRKALSWASFYEVAIGNPSQVHYSWQNSRRPAHSLTEVVEAMNEEDWKDSDYPRATSLQKVPRSFISQFNY